MYQHFHSTWTNLKPWRIVIINVLSMANKITLYNTCKCAMALLYHFENLGKCSICSDFIILRFSERFAIETVLSTTWSKKWHHIILMLHPNVEHMVAPFWFTCSYILYPWNTCMDCVPFESSYKNTSKLNHLWAVTNMNIHEIYCKGY